MLDCVQGTKLLASWLRDLGTSTTDLEESNTSGFSAPQLVMQQSSLANADMDDIQAEEQPRGERNSVEEIQEPLPEASTTGVRGHAKSKENDTAQSSAPTTAYLPAVEQKPDPQERAERRA